MCSLPGPGEGPAGARVTSGPGGLRFRLCLPPFTSLVLLSCWPSWRLLLRLLPSFHSCLPPPGLSQASNLGCRSAHSWSHPSSLLLLQFPCQATSSLHPTRLLARGCLQDHQTELTSRLSPPPQPLPILHCWWCLESPASFALSSGPANPLSLSPSGPGISCLRE